MLYPNNSCFLTILRSDFIVQLIRKKCDGVFTIFEVEPRYDHEVNHAWCSICYGQKLLISGGCYRSGIGLIPKVA
jgi:hypothetical protein